MTPAQYIETNYSDIKKWLYNITKGERPQLYEDFIHEVIIIFLENKKSQDAIDTGTARFFLVRIGLNQWRSSTSPLHYQYRDSFLDYTEKETAFEEYDSTEDVLMEVIFRGLDEMYNGTEKSKYEAILITYYFNNNSNYSEVGRQLNVPHTSVRKIVLRGLTRLQKIIFNDEHNGNYKLNNDIIDSWSANSSSVSQQALSSASQLFKSKYFSAT
jgi:RNA polymerase sigma factor (sigma-70 family)